MHANNYVIRKLELLFQLKFSIRSRIVVELWYDREVEHFSAELTQKPDIAGQFSREFHAARCFPSFLSHPVV